MEFCKILHWISSNWTKQSFTSVPTWTPKQTCSQDTCEAEKNPFSTMVTNVESDIVHFPTRDVSVQGEAIHKQIRFFH